VLDDLRAGAAAAASLAPADPVEGVAQANRAYIQGYRRNARMMALLTQLAGSDPEIRAVAVAIRSHFEERLIAAIRRWQHDGLAWSDLDPVYTANALAYMVDRFLYEWEELALDYDEERAADTLTKLWVRALGLATGPRLTAAGNGEGNGNTPRRPRRVTR
jgi:AcrR family transcriptional regulator